MVYYHRKMSKLKIVISFLLALISGTLGLFGFFGFCCTLTGFAILSFLGLTSISGFLLTYNGWLLLFSFLFFILAAFSYINYKKQKKNKTCLKK